MYLSSLLELQVGSETLEGVQAYFLSSACKLVAIAEQLITLQTMTLWSISTHS